MKRLLLGLVLAFAFIAPGSADTPVSYEAVTFDATSGGVAFSAATLTVANGQVKSCAGTLETAAIRYRFDGLGAVTSSEGAPLAVGQFIRIDGFTSLVKFRGIRTTGTSGVIRFTCTR